MCHCDRSLLWSLGFTCFKDVTYSLGMAYSTSVLWTRHLNSLGLNFLTRVISMILPRSIVSGNDSFFVFLIVDLYEIGQFFPRSTPKSLEPLQTILKVLSLSPAT